MNFRSSRSTANMTETVLHCNPLAKDPSILRSSWHPAGHLLASNDNFSMVGMCGANVNQAAAVTANGSFASQAPRLLQAGNSKAPVSPSSYLPGLHSGSTSGGAASSLGLLSHRDYHLPKSLAGVGVGTGLESHVHGATDVFLHGANPRLPFFNLQPPPARSPSSSTTLRSVSASASAPLGLDDQLAPTFLYGHPSFPQLDSSSGSGTGSGMNLHALSSDIGSLIQSCGWPEDCSSWAAAWADIDEGTCTFTGSGDAPSGAHTSSDVDAASHSSGASDGVHSGTQTDLSGGVKRQRVDMSWRATSDSGFILDPSELILGDDMQEMSVRAPSCSYGAGAVSPMALAMSTQLMSQSLPRPAESSTCTRAPDSSPGQESRLRCKYQEAAMPLAPICTPPRGGSSSSTGTRPAARGHGSGAGNSPRSVLNMPASDGHDAATATAGASAQVTSFRPLQSRAPIAGPGNVIMQQSNFLFGSLTSTEGVMDRVRPAYPGPIGSACGSNPGPPVHVHLPCANSQLSQPMGFAGVPPASDDCPRVNVLDAAVRSSAGVVDGSGAGIQMTNFQNHSQFASCVADTKTSSGSMAMLKAFSHPHAQSSSPTHHLDVVACTSFLESLQGVSLGASQEQGQGQRSQHNLPNLSSLGISTCSRGVVSDATSSVAVKGEYATHGRSCLGTNIAHAYDKENSHCRRSWPTSLPANNFELPLGSQIPSSGYCQPMTLDSLSSSISGWVASHSDNVSQAVRKTAAAAAGVASWQSNKVNDLAAVDTSGRAEVAAAGNKIHVSPTRLEVNNNECSQRKRLNADDTQDPASKRLKDHAKGQGQGQAEVQGQQVQAAVTGGTKACSTSTSASHKSVGPALNTNLKPRARQGSANDPQSIAARHRRERISERLKVLQDLVPNGSKVDLVTMLEKAINYVKSLQLQVKLLTTDEYWPDADKSCATNMEGMSLEAAARMMTETLQAAVKSEQGDRHLEA